MWYIYKDMYMVRLHFKSLNVVIDFSVISVSIFPLHYLLIPEIWPHWLVHLIDFFLNASTHQVKKLDTLAFLNRIDTFKILKFCFPSSRNGNIYLYIVTFSSCHYFFPQLEWYAELLGLHCSAWLLLFAICAALLGFFWLQWWLFCCMCVYIIVTFTNDLFTSYTLIYIDYISFF